MNWKTITWPFSRYTAISIVLILVTGTICVYSWAMWQEQSLSAWLASALLQTACIIYQAFNLFKQLWLDKERWTLERQRQELRQEIDEFSQRLDAMKRARNEQLEKEMRRFLQ